MQSLRCAEVPDGGAKRKREQASNLILPRTENRQPRTALAVIRQSIPTGFRKGRKHGTAELREYSHPLSPQFPPHANTPSELDNRCTAPPDAPSSPDENWLPLPDAAARIRWQTSNHRTSPTLAAWEFPSCPARRNKSLAPVLLLHLAWRVARGQSR